ncbi:MAG: SHD1 domain-containing protein [Pirellulaceae bacterium]
MRLLERLESDPSLSAFSGQFVPLKLVTNQNSEWANWSQRYEHEGNAIPILFVIRADGEQLYGKSGSLPGEALPEMLAAARAHSGRAWNVEESTLLKSCNQAATTALDQGDIKSAARALNPLARLGTIGSLQSFSADALAADELARQISELATAELNDIGDKIGEPDSAFQGVVELVQLAAAVKEFPTVGPRVEQLLSDLKQQDDVKQHLKPARLLVRARQLVASGKSRDRRQAEGTYASLITRHSESPAAAIARTELGELNPDAPALQSPPEEALRTWSDASGHYSVEARLVKVEGDKVHLEKADGTTVQVPIERLSESDRRYLARR